MNGSVELTADNLSAKITAKSIVVGQLLAQRGRVRGVLDHVLVEAAPQLVEIVKCLFVRLTHFFMLVEEERIRVENVGSETSKIVVCLKQKSLGGAIEITNLGEAEGGVEDIQVSPRVSHLLLRLRTLLLGDARFGDLLLQLLHLLHASFDGMNAVRL